MSKLSSAALALSAFQEGYLFTASRGQTVTPNTRVSLCSAIYSRVRSSWRVSIDNGLRTRESNADHLDTHVAKCLARFSLVCCKLFTCVKWHECPNDMFSIIISCAVPNKKNMLITEGRLDSSLLVFGILNVLGLMLIVCEAVPVLELQYVAFVLQVAHRNLMNAANLTFLIRA